MGGRPKVSRARVLQTAAPLIRRLFSPAPGFSKGAVVVGGRSAARRLAGRAAVPTGRSLNLDQQGEPSAALQVDLGKRAGGIDHGDCFPRDLFGEPMRPPRGKGRPRHEPTEQLRAKVRGLRLAGRTQPEIAAAIGLTVPTLALNYASELESTSQTGRRRAVLDQEKANGQ